MTDNTAPRFASPRPEELPEDRAAVYRAIASGPRRSQASVVPVADGEGRLLGPFGPMLLSPGVGAAVQELGSAIRFRGLLDDRRRECAILTLAARERSDFEWVAHEGAARNAGMAQADIDAVKSGHRPTGDLAEVWDLVREIGATGTLSDASYARAETGLGTDIVAELVWLCGYYAMLATALRVFDPPVPEGTRGTFAD